MITGRKQRGVKWSYWTTLMGGISMQSIIHWYSPVSAPQSIKGPVPPQVKTFWGATTSCGLFMHEWRCEKALAEGHALSWFVPTPALIDFVDSIDAKQKRQMEDIGLYSSWAHGLVVKGEGSGDTLVCDLFRVWTCKSAHCLSHLVLGIWDVSEDSHFCRCVRVQAQKCCDMNTAVG